VRAPALALLVALTANAAANLMIRAGMRGRPLPVTDPAGLLRAVVGSPLVLGGIALFALNVLCYAYALTRVPLTVAYPVMVGGGLLIVLACSVLLLREPLGWPVAAGGLLIAAGVVLAARGLG